MRRGHTKRAHSMHDLRVERRASILQTRVRRNAQLSDLSPSFHQKWKFSHERVRGGGTLVLVLKTAATAADARITNRTDTNGGGAGSR